MTYSLYTPAILAEARRMGITELQAYRNAKAREAFLRRNGGRVPAPNMLK